MIQRQVRQIVQSWLNLGDSCRDLRLGCSAYPLEPRFAGPRQGLAGGCAPLTPPNGNGTSWEADATCG